MHEYALDRINEHCRTNGFDALLLASPFHITWLTGYAPPIQTGPSPFEGGSALAWVQDGVVTLILADSEAPMAAATGALVREYTSYTIDAPLAGFERQAQALGTVLAGAGATVRKVGVDLNWLSAALARIVEERLDKAVLRPVGGELDQLRAVKSADELAKIRAALALCDMAQRYVQAEARAGMSELALWGAVKSHVEIAAGQRLPVLADLVCGARTGDVGGLPSSYVLQAGDAVLLDFVPRLDGYWGDNAAAHFIGEPPTELLKIYGIVRDVLRQGLDSLRPGVRASALDTQLRDAVRNAGYPAYPHHTGHGIGVTYHEEPRIVPYNDMVLEPGMVVALEPGIYLPGLGGVRLEHVAVVTETGCDVLTTHLPY